MDRFDFCAGLAVNLGLFLLLLLIGFNMGLDGTVLENFKKVGAKILFFPFAIMAGAFLAAALCSLLMDIDLRQSFAVTAGFGWYSLAPGIILERGLARCAAISFMHCIMREYFSLLLVPIVAKKGRIHGSNRPLRRHCNGRLSAHCREIDAGRRDDLFVHLRFDSNCIGTDFDPVDTGIGG